MLMAKAEARPPPDSASRPADRTPALLQRCGDHSCPPSGCHGYAGHHPLRPSATGRILGALPSVGEILASPDRSLRPSKTGWTSGAVPPVVSEVLSSPGQPLKTDTRMAMNASFGVDFGRVRVHTDARAAESARAVQASAFTVGRDVVFAAGRYAPDTPAGRQLLAHELTHVVQQGNRRPEGPTSTVAALSAEAEADRTANQVVSGGQAGSIRSGTPTGIQRQIGTPAGAPDPTKAEQDRQLAQDLVDVPASAPAAPTTTSAIQLSATEQGLVTEGLSRGAPDDTIIDALLRRGVDNPPPAPRAPFPRPGAAEGESSREITTRELTVGLLRVQLQPALTPLKVAFDSFVASEYEALSKVAKPSFDVAKGEPFGSPLEKYQALRASYYRAGWVNAKRDIFDRIVPAKILGVRIVGGVHELMVPVLDGMAKQLPEKTKAAFAADTLGVGGFVPRFIEDTSRLSNHAFGMALDIDPRWNPHIKGESDIAAFKQATGVELGERFFYGSEPAEETQRRLEEVSERLKTWLAYWLPLYEPLVEAKERARKGRTAKERAEARKVAADLQRDINQNPAAADLRALDTMVKNHGVAVVRGWQHGIGTIDPRVIDMFKQLGYGYGARSGNEYEKSKDIMHIELLPPLVLPKAAGPERPMDMLDVVPDPAAIEPAKPKRRRRR